MADVRETSLPGVGVRHDFTTDDGTPVGVLVHRDGRRDLMVYDRADPDACSGVLQLSSGDSRTLAELLGASQVTEAVTAVQQQIEGLSIEWLTISTTSPSNGATIGDGMFRTRTGCSVVAVLRGGETIPAPGPELLLQAHDVLVAVGTADGLRQLQGLIRG